jgi:anti-anti-sigma factor
MSLSQQPDDLQAAVDQNKIFLRITGRGSFKVSTALKQFLESVTSHLSISKVVIDLKDCIGMDSTFMGVLAGLSGRLKKAQCDIVLIRVSEKNKHLLTTLGVDQVVDICTDTCGNLTIDSEVESLSVRSSQKDLAETALKAHEDLAELTEENQPRFKRVIELLREDVDRLK